MPTERNNIKVGTPYLYEVRPAIILANNKIDPTSKMFSMVIFIGSFCCFVKCFAIIVSFYKDFNILIVQLF